MGDRVVLHGLQKASYLNGKHGCIGGCRDKATGRYPIHLDLEHDRSTTEHDQKIVMAKATNLKPELVSQVPVQLQQRDDMDSHIKEEKESESRSRQRNRSDYGVDALHLAKVSQGTLVEEEGRALCLILDAIRFLVGHVLLEDSELQTGLADIDILRKQGPKGLLKMNHLMGVAWSCWNKKQITTTVNDDNKSSNKKSIYELLVQFFRDLPKTNGCELNNMPREYLRALAALKHPTAVLGWHVRLHGDFWIVGYASEDKEQDDNARGAIVVSAVDRRQVFKVFGVRNSLIGILEPFFSSQPMILMRLTMIPWYGRLVYDGVVVPSHGQPGLPNIANDKQRAELEWCVQLARQQGMIVEHITSAPPVGDISHDRDDEMRVPSPRDPGSSMTCRATKLEYSYLAKLRDLPVSPDKKLVWCLRRKGYTDQDNPLHMGVIITNASGGLLMGTFTCTALAPNAADILKALVMTGRKTGASSKGATGTVNSAEQQPLLPLTVLVDDLPCCERLKFLLKEYLPKFPLRPEYYRPPKKL